MRAGKWGSPCSSKAMGWSWPESTRWNTTPESWSILISRRRSSWITQARRARGSAYFTLLTSLSSAIETPGGKNGRQRKSCDGLPSETPIGTVPERKVAGAVRLAQIMRSDYYRALLARSILGGDRVGVPAQHPVSGGLPARRFTGDLDRQRRIRGRSCLSNARFAGRGSAAPEHCSTGRHLCH